jgi:hypothetical protein
MDINNLSTTNFGFGGDGMAVGSVDPDALYKALTAGDSADPANMGTGGNTLQFESLESQLVSALAERTEDFKLMKLQPKNPVGSTVHQYTQETDSGSYDGLGTAELGDPIESISEFARITRNVKYFQTKREASVQANSLRPIVGGRNGEAVEERLGTHVMLKGTEYYCFHGDETVSPNLPSGYPKQIRDEASQNVFDMSGLKISDAGGEEKLEEAIGSIWDQGGDISDIFYPSVVAQDWQNLLKDRYRYNAAADTAGSNLSFFQSMYGGKINIAGRAGMDKMYKVKVRPSASPLAALRPNAPTFALAAQATTGGTGFLASTAGTYRYTVFAIDASGLISVAAAEANLVLAAGQEAQITITRGATVNGAYATGYIVCRGKKDVTTGTDVREMFRVPASGVADTIALDQNDELPGTAEMLLLTSNGVERTYQWDSFLDLRRFNLGPTRASIPFLLIWYGTPDLKIAKFNGILKNVGHKGIDGWF